MKVSRGWKYFLTVVWLLSGLALAETINWDSPPQKTNLTSDGSPMDATYQFQLGVFSGGFVPTASNACDWATYWTPADSSGYNPASNAKSYGSDLVVLGNAAPFTVGAKAYVWGRSAGTGHDEWILFRSSDWTWPAPNPMNPFGLDWSAADANEVVLGSVNGSGNPFLMKSEAVRSYAQWRDGALVGETSNAPGDDPDHDGVSNLLEFLFGTPPTQPGAPPVTPVDFVSVSGQSHLRISIPRLRDRLASVTVEVSSDLVIWQSGSAATVEMSNTPELLVVRDLTAFGPGLPKRFMRIKAVIRP
jgi:hypothetical protein